MTSRMPKTTELTMISIENIINPINKEDRLSVGGLPRPNDAVLGKAKNVLGLNICN